MERGQSYGSPTLNHERIAALWSTILGTEITPHEVVLCMLGVKISRLMETPTHLDSWTDIAGYSGVGYAISQGE